MRIDTIMDRRVSIPVRVVRPAEYQTALSEKEGAIPAAQLRPSAAPQAGRGGEPAANSPVEQQGAGAAERRSGLDQATREPVPQDEPDVELEEWRDRALRLQADMENYRKRQQRSAQDQIRQERSRLLNAFLGIVDDLERALATPAGGDNLSHGVGLRRGVELTHRAARQLLEKEGVAVIVAEQQPFDPNWHEAVATVPRDGTGVAPGTVIQVVEPGYRIDEQLLRPARVVVAV
jgi:molecular chaperone GrpE